MLDEVTESDNTSALPMPWVVLSIWCLHSVASRIG